MDQQNQSVNSVKYLFLFAVFYIVTSLIASFILQYFELERNFGISIGILIASAMAVSNKFVSDENRVPARSEKHILIWGSIAISIVVSIFGLVLIAVIENIPLGEIFAIFTQVPLSFLAVGMLLVTGAYWLILFFCYGSGAKIIAKSRNVGSEKPN